MERWQAGPALKTSGATIIPIAHVTSSAFRHGAHATLTPAAVVVRFDHRTYLWNLDERADSLESWLQRAPELTRLLAASMESENR